MAMLEATPQHLVKMKPSQAEGPQQDAHVVTRHGGLILGPFAERAFCFFLWEDQESL